MTKKGFMRIAALIMIFIMVAVGCSSKGGDADVDNQSDDVTSNASDTKKDGGSSSDQLFNEPGELPIVNEPITLTIFAPANGEFSWAENLQTVEIEEKTGINIEWQIAASSDNIQTKISTIFASGDLPDIIFTNVGNGDRFDKASEQSFGLQGLVLPLNEYFDTISVGYKKAFEENQGFRDFITTPSGEIYSLPNLDGSLHVQYSMKCWINETWLDNLGLETPTTVEDFEKVLRAFKEQDANGNGDPTDEIPLSTVVSGGGVQLDGFLMAPYQLTPSDNKLYIEDGNVTYAPVQEGYREGLRWLNRMYEEGLIYPESFTQDKNTQINLNESGDETVIGCFLALRPGYAADLTTYPDNSKRWEEYSPLAPLEGPDGTRQAAWNPYVQFQTGMVYITSQCTNPEAAFRLLDYLATEEMSMRSALGIKDVDWREAVEGEYGLDGEPATYARLDANTDNGQWNQLACLIRTEEMVNDQAFPQDPYSEDVRPLDGRQLLMYESSKMQEEVRQPFESVMPDLYMTAEDASEMALLKSTINDIQNQLMTQMIIGTMDLDTDWDSYISQLENSGLNRYLEIQQKAYDASIYSN